MPWYSYCWFLKIEYLTEYSNFALNIHLIRMSLDSGATVFGCRTLLTEHWRMICTVPICCMYACMCMHGPPLDLVWGFIAANPNITTPGFFKMSNLQCILIYFVNYIFSLLLALHTRKTISSGNPCFINKYSIS